MKSQSSRNSSNSKHLQRKKIGGARPGAGRPRFNDQPLVPLSVTLTRDQRDWLRDQPGGASAAIRALIDAARAL